MLYRRNWISITVVISCVIMFMLDAQAQQQEFEGIQCNALTVNMLHSSPELGVSSLDQKGIIQSTHANKLFDNWTRHSIMIFKRTNEKMSWNGVTKTQAPDGDMIIWEFSGDSQRDTVVKPILGTGKWKGVKGEYKSTRITKGKPIAPNTDQYCEKIVGWIELPK